VLPVRFSVDLVEQVDGRSMLGRAVRDRLERLYRDLGGRDDGSDLSFQQQSLATHAVWIDLTLSAEECKISPIAPRPSGCATGHPSPPGALGLAASDSFCRDRPALTCATSLRLARKLAQ
jgi:hypothetical protein